MYSDKPKSLHTLAGKPLLEHVYRTVQTLDHRQICIVYGNKQLLEAFPDFKVSWVKQEKPLGTGHAVKQALPEIPDNDYVLTLYGDVPLAPREQFVRLVEAASETGFSLLTSRLDDPTGYGRIIRNDNGDIIAVVEERDATKAQRGLDEVNTGFMVVKADRLKQWINVLDNDNQQHEYYLTDIVGKAVQDNINIVSVMAGSGIELRGVNTHSQLAEAECYYRSAQARRLMDAGVGIIDPARFDLRGELKTGRDVKIDINVIIEGHVELGNNVHIGANCHIKDSVIGNNVGILANTMIDNATISDACRIGPFARIRPGTVLDRDIHIGNFVELKKTTIGEGSKANHLSYLGDSLIGTNTNIGAGTITCNYDGARKHITTIGNNVFIGSHVQLVAPIRVEDDATIAAGTTVSKDVRKNVLVVGRPRQREIKHWKRPLKE